MKNPMIVFLMAVMVAALVLPVSGPDPVLAAESQLVWPSIRVVAALSGFSRPIHIANAGDGSGRLFVAEQAGIIRVIKDGVVLPTPFLDFSAKVRSPANGGGGEEGLLSVAFSPNFSSDRHLYIYYTAFDGDNRVARFSASGDPDRVDAASEKTILVLPHPGYTNHNGGQLAFGPDGYLYIGTGDGGGGDPNGNARDPSSLLGKILRIDVDMPFAPAPAHPFRIYLPFVGGGAGQPYRIPPDNPFLRTPGYRPEIWATGLRNPWRFSFDPINGDLFLGDVGQGNWEEINVQPAASAGGEDYGWNIMEGAHCYGATSCATAGLTLPVAEYSHAVGCSVTGGAVYRGVAFPALQGIYLYGDFCTGVIFGLARDGVSWQSQLLLDTAIQISTFGVDETGEVYLAGLGNGVLYRIEP